MRNLRLLGAIPVVLAAGLIGYLAVTSSDAPAPVAAPTAIAPAPTPTRSSTAEPATPAPTPRLATGGEIDAEAPSESLAGTAADLADFYQPLGGRSAFPDHYVAALEALLYGEDDLAAGDLTAARLRVDQVLADTPLNSIAWRDGTSFGGRNVGDPIAYYGLRMLDQILEIEPIDSVGTLTMTAVVAPCAQVSRPTADLTEEIVQLDIDSRILDNDAATLRAATNLFRRWVRAITGGLDVELVVHEMGGCTTVTYTDDGEVIVSYPDADAMVSSVPESIAAPTDFWWVIAPSGVPGDGSGYDRHFITGGMGVTGTGLPLLLSDDMWFLRKPEHLGTGPYTPVEIRAYQPQWFQHEFMHHLFRAWPEFELEATPHQWFDRSTWPEDFVGIHESDYYIEAINKRLLGASPSLADGLKAPDGVAPSALTETMLVGTYHRIPVENEWHEVTVTVENGGLRWTNKAGVSWSLVLRDTGLWAGPDAAYGEQKLHVEAADEVADVLWFGGEAYLRQ